MLEYQGVKISGCQTVRVSGYKRIRVLGYQGINWFSIIITPVIIEICTLPLAENGVIFRYNHLCGVDYSGRMNFLKGRIAFCPCA